MAGVRVSGLASGMDTEALVSQLSKAYQTKVDKVKKQQTKAEWKKEAWAALNTKIYDFYKNSLATFKSTSTYRTKAVSGDLKGIKVKAGSNAVSGSHKVKVIGTASAQMWTGKKINNSNYTATSYVGTSKSDVALSTLQDKDGNAFDVSKLNGSSFSVYADGKTVDVTLSADANTTMQDVVDSINSQLKTQGLDGKLTASVESGRLTFTNTTAEALVNDATGETTYSGGYSMIITAANKESAEALGLAYNEDGKGTPVDALGEGVEANSVSGVAIAYDEVTTADTKVTGSSKLVDLGIANGTVIKVNGNEITVDRTTTLNSLAKSMEDAGINASYDANQGRFYLSSKATGTENAFTIETDDDTMQKLGLDLADSDPGKISASDASIVYNGVTYTQSTNNFDINGLTFEVTEEGEEQTFSVDTDVDGIYNKVKDFIKSYNALIEEMNTLYNAKSSKGYDPLTEDEKDAMSDKDVENWEKTIKDSLLRRDSTISSLLTSMRTTLNKSIEVTNADGTTSRFSLASFGIVTGEWSERGLLHINGNSEDADYADFEDKLKKAIAANADAVEKTFAGLGDEMYTNLQKAMRRTELSSALTFYNDKQLDSEINDYKDKVKVQQEKMTAAEDKYYKQFSAMETAMAKLQSQQTYISQLFGN